MAPDDRDVLPDRTRELAGDRDRDPGLGDVLPFPRRRPDRVAAPSPRLRSLIGEVLRDERRSQARTLADVARDAAVSLPYLSEVERGRKEVSSEVLGAICEALDVPLADVLEQVVRRLRVGAQGGSGVLMLAA